MFADCDFLGAVPSSGGFYMPVLGLVLVIEHLRGEDKSSPSCGVRVPCRVGGVTCSGVFRTAVYVSACNSI